MLARFMLDTLVNATIKPAITNAVRGCKEITEDISHLPHDIYAYITTPNEAQIKQKQEKIIKHYHETSAAILQKNVERKKRAQASKIVDTPEEHQLLIKHKQVIVHVLAGAEKQKNPSNYAFFFAKFRKNKSFTKEQIQALEHLSTAATFAEFNLLLQSNLTLLQSMAENNETLFSFLEQQAMPKEYPIK